MRQRVRSIAFFCLPLTIFILAFNLLQHQKDDKHISFVAKLRSAVKNNTNNHTDVLIVKPRKVRKTLKLKNAGKATMPTVPVIRSEKIRAILEYFKWKRKNSTDLITVNPRKFPRSGKMKLILETLKWEQKNKWNLPGEDFKPTNETKIILVWFDHLYRSDSFLRGELMNMKNCGLNNCILSKDWRLANVSDVIVFNAPPLFRLLQSPDAAKTFWDVLPTRQRTPNQRWVFFTWESPCVAASPKSRDAQKFASMFNWTMTYRLDSDMFAPYGKVVKRSLPISLGYLQTEVLKKTKLVAWLVSNCKANSKRDQYVKELNKHIPIDIFGECGDPCPPDCFRYIGDNYKFYLAFENSISRDYVTEKLFRTLQDWNIVPITRGGANYSLLGILPEMHINTGDFSTPQALADYLYYLDKHPNIYMKFLQWKRHFEIVRPTSRVDYCKICEMLNNPSIGNKTYTVQKLVKWYWGTQSNLGRYSECKYAQDI